MFTFFYKNRWRSNLRSDKKNLKIEFSKRGVNLIYTLLNRYNVPELPFLFKKGLSLVIRRLSFSSNTHLPFSLVITNLEHKPGIQEKMITVPKKPLLLGLPYLGPLSSLTRTKLRKSFPVLLIFTNYRLRLRVKRNYLTLFVLKIAFQKNIHPVSYKGSSVVSTMTCVKHLSVRIGDHIGISPLSKKKAKPNLNLKLCC